MEDRTEQGQLFKWSPQGNYWYNASCPEILVIPPAGNNIFCAVESHVWRIFITGMGYPECITDAGPGSSTESVAFERASFNAKCRQQNPRYYHHDPEIND